MRSFNKVANVKVHIISEQFNVIVRLCQRVPSDEHAFLCEGLHRGDHCSWNTCLGEAVQKSLTQNLTEMAHWSTPKEVCTMKNPNPSIVVLYIAATQYE